MNFNSKIKLESVSVREKNENNVFTFDLSTFKVDNLNLLIGDNAQGKTRFFTFMKVLKFIFMGSYVPLINFRGEYGFVIQDESGKAESVTYILEIKKDNNGINKFSEKVKKGEVDLLDTAQDLYLDESTGEKIKKDYFFFQPNVPTLLNFSGEKFKTIEAVKEFIQRICFIDTNRQNISMPNIGATIPDTQGLDIAEVLHTWKQDNPNAYDDVIHDFKEYFPFIEDVMIEEVPMNPAVGMPVGLKSHFLVLKEKKLSFRPPQALWSEGMLRALTLLAMPKSYMNIGGKKMSPSLICIDEIENSLDFKSLNFIFNYYKESSDQIQTLISSHSPLVCGFIHPKHWRVVKRSGAFVKMFNPISEEPDLEKKLNVFKHDYWEFYKRHISNNPDLYKTEEPENE